MNSSLLGFKSLCCLSLALSLTGCTTWKALTFKEDKIDSGITTKQNFVIQTWYVPYNESEHCEKLPIKKRETEHRSKDGMVTRSVSTVLLSGVVTVAYNLVDNEITGWIDNKKSSFTRSYNVTGNYYPNTDVNEMDWSLCVLVNRVSQEDGSIYSTIGFRLDNHVKYNVSQLSIPYVKIVKSLAVTDSKSKSISLQADVKVLGLEKKDSVMSEISNSTLRITGLSLGQEYSYKKNVKLSDVSDKTNINVITPYLNSPRVNSPLSFVVTVTEIGTGADNYEVLGNAYKNNKEQILIVSKEYMKKILDE